ncbi:MAG: hypothetical protein V2I76_00995 [Roseobacter sp.]|jgi:hypothetical protein|nr:hypothetical protein [Roseobacter sp.]
MSLISVLLVSFFSIFTSSIVTIASGQTLLTGILTYYLFSLIALMILGGTALAAREGDT